MEIEEGQDVQKSSQSTAPRLPKSYNFLIQLSRKMGTVATKSSIVHDVRSFMNQEISISPSERVLGNALPKLTVSKPEREQTQDTPTGKTKIQKQKDLQKIVSQSHQLLMSANTVFPMSLFPDTVTVDRTKVTITRRDFFWSSDTLSIRIEDVLNVQVSLGPLFGSLTIASRVMSTIDHFKIGHLWRSDAIRLKHIIQGYMIAQHNKIDTSHLSKKDLIETLIELGHDSN
ncbi:MAG: hypothetical protein JWO07_61 [Candidatus Saccharibacteria bacterium]|nr:hypothetical protein [Candidatus Saccharibacteria bacterium]